MTEADQTVLEWLESERNNMTDVHQIAHVNSQIHKIQEVIEEESNAGATHRLRLKMEQSEFVRTVRHTNEPHTTIAITRR